MKNRYAVVFLLSFSGMLLLFHLGGCTGQNSGNRQDGSGELKGKITITGAFALYPITVRWAEEFRKLHPRVTINISAGGAGKGMADALSGMVDLGMYSKEVSPEERARGAWYVGVARDAVLPTVNAENPVMSDLQKKGLTRDMFFRIFIEGSVKTWGEATGTTNRSELHTFTRSDACGAADMWARYLNGRTQEDLQGYGVNGDPGVADAIRRNVEGIGYNNMNFIYDIQTQKKYPGLEVVPIDLNANGTIDPEENFYGTLGEVMKAIADGRYPSPPARELYFVSNGKPTDTLVLTFLRYIMTEGQQHVAEAGYVNLDSARLVHNLSKLD